MMGGLEDSVLDLKKYFLKVIVDGAETQLDFQSTWVRPIRKGELEYRFLEANDKITVSKIIKFVPEYLQRYGSKSEFDAEECRAWIFRFSGFLDSIDIKS